jgi:RNase P subunit RPR2
MSQRLSFEDFFRRGRAAQAAVDSIIEKHEVRMVRARRRTHCAGCHAVLKKGSGSYWCANCAAGRVGK